MWYYHPWKERASTIKHSSWRTYIPFNHQICLFNAKTTKSWSELGTWECTGKKPSHQVDEHFADKSCFLDVNDTPFYETFEFYLGAGVISSPDCNSNQPCRTSIPGGWDLHTHNGEKRVFPTMTNPTINSYDFFYNPMASSFATFFCLKTSWWIRLAGH